MRNDEKYAICIKDWQHYKKGKTYNAAQLGFSSSSVPNAIKHFIFRKHLLTVGDDFMCISDSYEFKTGIVYKCNVNNELNGVDITNINFLNKYFEYHDFLILDEVHDFLTSDEELEKVYKYATCIKDYGRFKAGRSYYVESGFAPGKNCDMYIDLDLISETLPMSWKSLKENFRLKENAIALNESYRCVRHNPNYPEFKKDEIYTCEREGCILSLRIKNCYFLNANFICVLPKFEYECVLGSAPPKDIGTLPSEVYINTEEGIYKISLIPKRGYQKAKITLI